MMVPPADGCMKKCPKGMFSEIKYDGERIQIHKKGNDYAFFSRNLKPILEWKVAEVKDYIPQVQHGVRIQESSHTLMSC